MRLVTDADLSPKVAAGLRDAGYAAAHVRDLDLLHASDEQIFEYAVAGGYTIITADTDFSGAIVSLSPTRMAVRTLPLRPAD